MHSYDVGDPLSDILKFHLDFTMIVKVTLFFSSLTGCCRTFCSTEKYCQYGISMLYYQRIHHVSAEEESHGLV
jgi:hypothetical protein